MGNLKLPPGVRVESESSITIDFRYRGVRCRERIPLKPTTANIKAAARHREAVLDAIARGVFDYAATFPQSLKAALFSPALASVPVLLSAWLDGWLEGQDGLVASSTLRGYRTIVTHQLIPALGHIPVADLRRSHVRDWAAGLGVSNKRLANILSPLRLALAAAVEDELIETNPLLGWSYRRREAPRSGYVVDPFSAEEQAAILAALPDAGRPLVQFAFWTGLRTSELCALEWGDVDWLRGVVVVVRALTQAAKEPEVTKTKAGTREVKLLPLALAALKAQKAWSLLHPSGRVFLAPHTAQPWEGDQAIRQRLWRPALLRAGVRYRNPYQTRHTYASMMLSAGENPLWVSAQMGHADTKMVFRSYGRFIPESAPDAGGLAHAVFGGKYAEN
ncbi:MAG: DUF3596 domain-containing protein [Gammaproteobacteria bacterium]|nr:DUF3596 domain-containing protein [Gammaproteobacteria bacterium]